MTIQAFVTYFRQQLSALNWYDAREVKSMALRLLEEVAGVPSYKVIVEPQMELEATFVERLERMTAELATGRPLQYVLGYEMFCGHKFSVGEGVLIPRPETEELVGLVLNDIKQCRHGFTGAGESDAALPLRVLDICTGSGCIAWSIAAGIAELCRCGADSGSGECAGMVLGCDISDEALEIAANQGVCDDLAPVFFKCDILEAGAYETISRYISAEKLDVIVSNPPYVCEQEKEQMRPNVLDFEPDCALFVPDGDPLKFYRRIARLSGKLLKQGGRLYFEVNERFAGETAQMMGEYGFGECKVAEDLFGKPRMVWGVFFGDKDVL